MRIQKNYSASTFTSKVQSAAIFESSSRTRKAKNTQNMLVNDQIKPNSLVMIRMHAEKFQNFHF